VPLPQTPVIAILAAGVAGAAAATPVVADAAQCPVTQAAGAAAFGQFWFGSAAAGLSALLPTDGVWQGLGSAQGFRNKLFWQSAEFRLGGESELTVTGRRLDGEAAPARVSRPTNAFLKDDGGWSLLVLVEFPAAGCWKLQGEFRGHVLRFVTQVAAPGE
jgi:opacity protein-like surface antigen